MMGGTEAEARYSCANYHEWTTLPTRRMKCPHCGTTTVAVIEASSEHDPDVLRKALEAIGNCPDPQWARTRALAALADSGDDR